MQVRPRSVGAERGEGGRPPPPIDPVLWNEHRSSIHETNGQGDGKEYWCNDARASEANATLIDRLMVRTISKPYHLFESRSELIMPWIIRARCALGRAPNDGQKGVRNQNATFLLDCTAIGS